MPSLPVDRSTWVPAGSSGLTSASSVETARSILERRGAVLLGWHYHYAGGGSRSAVSFTTPDAYVRHLDRARPGDHLTIYDLDSIARHALLHTGDAGSNHPFDLTPIEWDLVRAAARKRSGVLVVRRFIGRLSGDVEATMTEADDEEERWQEVRRGLHSGRGEVVAFDFAFLDEDQHGAQVTTVSPSGGQVRQHALFDGKVPSDEGTVPLSGPY